MLKRINIKIYFIVNWLFSVYLCTNFLQEVPNNTPIDHLHTVLLLITYAAMYQGPAVLAFWLCKRWRMVAIVFAVIFSVIAQVLVFIDSHLYDLYAFHINGFVWNLVRAKGGIESLGADQTSILSVAGYVVVLIVVQLCALLLAYKYTTLRVPIAKIVVFLLLATLAERGIYGYSQAILYAPVLERGDAMPLYQPMKIHTLLKLIGVDVKKAKKIRLKQNDRALNYPKHPLAIKKVVQPPNIIILAVESLRWDMLNSVTMPHMYAFAQHSWNFLNHYSGGNGTRQGLFALFYGIHGNYWDQFLRQRQGPVFFDVLKKYNYQYFIYTSAKFSYPEFDQTIFRNIPSSKLHENSVGEPWRRDVKSTTELINAIAQRKHSEPFFGFMFYEATHARYSFDEQHVVNKNYLKYLDYSGLSRKRLLPEIAGLKARYDNAAFGVDAQLQRIIAALQKSGDIKNTIVIITGDHGEEFMERGRWGHNSSFSQWQVHVPMIVSMPGSTPRAIEDRTSHMDVVPTILPMLGVQNLVKDYSLGIDMANPIESRNIVVASWSDIGLINDFGKLVIPYKSTTQHSNLATDADDHPVDGSALATKMQTIIRQALLDAIYYRK